MNALIGLKKLPDESIDMVITSPPYFNMRDYGKSTEAIWDGQPNCKHSFGKPIIRKRDGGGNNAYVYNNRKKVDHFTNASRFCIKCGAWKGQLGLEPDFRLYVKHLLDIFEEIKRVLKKEGTCWINLGDTYGTNNICKNPKVAGKLVSICTRKKWTKCLLGIPERFVIGMIQREWTLRNKIIWHKPNHIPSPVNDRFTQTWEYMMLFSKSKKYYFDLDAVRVPHKRGTLSAERDFLRMKNGMQEFKGKRKNISIQNSFIAGHPKGKNPGDFWSIATKPFKDAHFAVFPEQLIEKPILAGCPGINNKSSRGIVLDPFMGSGTTAVVAQRLNRDFIGFEANPEYIKIARKRIKENQMKSRRTAP